MYITHVMYMLFIYNTYKKIMLLDFCSNSKQGYNNYQDI